MTDQEKRKVAADLARKKLENNQGRSEGP